jgi:SHAQKYF class myb-like DNA-binding protein
MKRFQSETHTPLAEDIEPKPAPLRLEHENSQSPLHSGESEQVSVDTIPVKKGRKEMTSTDPQQDTHDTPNRGRWTEAECKAFDAAIKKYGDNWKKVCGEVKTRTRAQVMSHVQKHYDKVKKEQLEKLRLALEKAKALIPPSSPNDALKADLPFAPLFNIVRHYQSPSQNLKKNIYELEYKVIIVPRSEIEHRLGKGRRTITPAPPARPTLALALAPVPPAEERVQPSPAVAPSTLAVRPEPEPEPDRRENRNMVESPIDLGNLDDFAGPSPVPARDNRGSDTEEEVFRRPLRPTFAQLFDSDIEN